MVYPKDPSRQEVRLHISYSVCHFTDQCDVVGFEVHYVAENHDNLHRLLVFLTVTGAVPGVDIEAEVLPSLSDDSFAGSERLTVKSGPYTSLPLILPAHVAPGKQDIKVQSGHYEIKLPTLPSIAVSPDPAPLLGASQLTLESPTSFICASCSLPLVQSSRIDHYRDLPSDHWQELIDTWMCHPDQKLNREVSKHGKGFWPEHGQALVGGSYILFDEYSITKNNLCPDDQSKVSPTRTNFYFDMLWSDDLEGRRWPLHQRSCALWLLLCAKPMMVLTRFGPGYRFIG